MLSVVEKRIKININYAQIRISKKVNLTNFNFEGTFTQAVIFKKQSYDSL